VSLADVKESQRAENQFRLLISRRFAPFFWTQFLGAFNDNVFKNFLILILAFQVAKADSGMSSNTLINIAAGLFILPFFLFSALAGQMADKYEKSQLITYTKALEVFIMMAASGAFFFQSHATLLILLFFLGLQATLFGPVKYSIIPQHLTQGELVGGNAMVEMGTFVAILIGTITGGLLVQLPGHVYWLSGGVCLIAVAGFLTSLAIPHAAANAPNLNIGWNPVRETLRNIGFAREPKSVFLSILGISWFWFLGTSYLTQLPNYTKDILHGSEGVVTLLLTMFSIGIGIGSLLCERLSGHKVELGLVPFGSIGLTVFGLDLFWVHRTPIPTEGLMTLQQFMATPGSLRVLIDLVMIGIFGGFNIVPLYALVQLRTKTQNRARVIAANNILNAFFMVLASLLAISLIGLSGLTIPQYFLVLVLMNCCVAAYIYNVIPEFLMRFLIWMLTHTMYRVQHRNFHFIPDEGPAVIVCNHVSLVDGPLIAGACRRPIRFVIFEPIYRMPVLNFIFRTGKAIPIDSQQRNSEVYNRAFDLIAQALDEGELICIFPEGKMTSDGEIDFFRPGIEKIVNRSPVPVIPMALRGLWGSFFSNRGGYALTHRPRRFWSKVEIVAGLPVAPQEVTAHGLQEIVQELRGEYP
jgi:1-acyl-sn-glycerol-3-phosphate acyltransferase